MRLKEDLQFSGSQLSLCNAAISDRKVRNRGRMLTTKRQERWERANQCFGENYKMLGWLGRKVSCGGKARDLCQCKGERCHFAER